MTMNRNATSDAFSVKIPKKKLVDFEEALEYTGFGKYNIVLILACGLTLIASNSENYSVGYVLPSAKDDLKLDNTKKGLLTSSTFVGILISSLFWGFLSDRNGRRKLICVTQFIGFIVSSLATFMPDFWSLLVMRFITGICISGPSAIIFAYFSEFQSASKRPKAMALISLFIGFALMLLPILGWIILSTNIDFQFLGWFRYREWRFFMLITAMPNLLAAIALLFFPESPKYLYYSGKPDEALEVMKKIYALNTGYNAADFPIESLDISQKPVIEEKGIFAEMYDNVVDVFKPPCWKYSVAGSVLQIGLFAISSGVLLWYPDIVNELEKNTSDQSLSVCKALSMAKNSTEKMPLQDNIFIQNIIIAAAYLLGFSLWGIIVKTIGNRWVFIGSMILSTLATIIICFVGQKIVINIMFILVLVLPGICVPVVNALVVDLTPTHLCGMAVCIIMTAGRLGSIISSSVVGILLDWNCMATFLMYGAVLFGCMLISLIFPKKS